MSSFKNSSYFNSVPSFDFAGGFTPPAGVQQLTFGRDITGRPIVIGDGSVPYDPQASYEADLSLLRRLIAEHDWYYKYRDDHGQYMRGFRNEQQIENLVRQRGGVFETIWNTEKVRHGAAAS